jgi:hypothetical protein
MDYLDAAKIVHAACVRGKNPERLQPVVPYRGALAPRCLILPYVYQNAAAHTFADILFLAIAHFTSIAKADVSPDLTGSRPTLGSSIVAPGKWPGAPDAGVASGSFETRTERDRWDLSKSFCLKL